MTITRVNPVTIAVAGRDRQSLMAVEQRWRRTFAAMEPLFLCARLDNLRASTRSLSAEERSGLIHEVQLRIRDGKQPRIIEGTRDVYDVPGLIEEVNA